MPIMERWHPGTSCCDPQWEAAYRRFESPEQERAKFVRRLESLGAGGWSRDAIVLELFCGRGNGLAALSELGFHRLNGVDLSETLLHDCGVDARLFVGDCRELKLPDHSVNIVVVQGGLHHLPDLPADLARTLAEVRRVLQPTGRLVIVEPWDTLFLKTIHLLCGMPVARKSWSKLDALATMIDHERVTYENWLARPQQILSLLDQSFRPETKKIGWGKLAYVGFPRGDMT